MGKAGRDRGTGGQDFLRTLSPPGWLEPVGLRVAEAVRRQPVKERGCHSQAPSPGCVGHVGEQIRRYCRGYSAEPGAPLAVGCREGRSGLAQGGLGKRHREG